MNIQTKMLVDSRRDDAARRLSHALKAIKEQVSEVEDMIQQRGQVDPRHVYHLSTYSIEAVREAEILWLSLSVLETASRTAAPAPEAANG